MKKIKQIFMVCVIIVIFGKSSIATFAEEMYFPISASDFYLTGKWTYIDNIDNNPVPVLIDQGSNTWLLAMYHGTKISLDMIQTCGTYYEPFGEKKSDYVTISGTNNTVTVGASAIGTDIIALRLEDYRDEDEIKYSATQVMLIVNVVPAQPNTGNGEWTNNENSSFVPNYIVEQRFQQVANAIYNDTMSDYKKVKATWDWMIENITYDWDTYYYKHLGNTELGKVKYGVSPFGIGAIVDGLAVCDGYADIFNKFMKCAGIKSRKITGTYRGEGHAWNQVKLGEQWYNIDVTWGDRDDEFFSASANYDYFLVGSHTLLFESEDETFYDKHKPNSMYIDEMDEAVADYPVDHEALWRENNMKDPNYYYDAEEDSFVLIEGSAVDNFYRYAVWDDELEDYVYDYSVDQQAMWWE